MEEDLKARTHGSKEASFLIAYMRIGEILGCVIVIRFKLSGRNTQEVRIDTP